MDQVTVTFLYKLLQAACFLKFLNAVFCFVDTAFLVTISAGSTEYEENVVITWDINKYDLGENFDREVNGYRIPINGTYQ